MAVPLTPSCPTLERDECGMMRRERGMEVPGKKEGISPRNTSLYPQHPLGSLTP